jgi:hypothetical protein
MPVSTKLSRLHRPRDLPEIDAMGSMVPFVDPLWMQVG